MTNTQDFIPRMQARALSVTYSGRVALEEVDLDMPGRSVTALIGPSGCGKSTFLRALNRMHDLVPEAQIRGRVLLDGRDVLAPDVDVVELRRRVGMVFQRSTPFPKSIFDNVAFGLRMAGLRERHELEGRVEASLRAAALWQETKDRLRDSALALSGGQQQRLCIARAIATKPDVLLLDEPASALDPRATEEIEALMLALSAVYTIVVVTHSLAQARRVGDRAAFFFLGRLVEAGAASNVLLEPSDPRTRAYVSGRVG